MNEKPGNISYINQLDRNISISEIENLSAPDSPKPAGAVRATNYTHAQNLPVIAAYNVHTFFQNMGEERK